MPIVTDKQYYMDTDLKDLLDLCIERERKKWDNLLVVSGMERAGKTVFAVGMCYYWANTTGKKFGVENIFFDPEEIIKFATTTRNQIIMWDESAFGGQSSQWHTAVQRKLNTMLMVAGKYGHYFVFIIPSFFRLNRYMALDRSIGLLNVYSPDLVSRGLFCCYNREQKTWIYNNNRKSETFGKQRSFDGRFTLKNTQELIDYPAYEDKKDAAINKFLNFEEDKKDLALKEIRFRVATQLPLEEAKKIGDCSKATVYNWRKSLGNAVLV